MHNRRDINANGFGHSTGASTRNPLWWSDRTFCKKDAQVNLLASWSKASPGGSTDGHL